MSILRMSALTLFPGMFEAIRNEGVVARGIKDGLLEIETVFLRDFSLDERRNVDERPIGGGDGMVLRADVSEAALKSVLTPESYVVHLTPAAKVFDRDTARILALKPHIIFMCGRYAGFDERVLDKYVHLHLSIGDFVLSGGELACMCIMDSVARFVPGILGNQESAVHDSFEDGLLEGPSYTKPLEFHNAKVPEVLLSGDHKKISAYRREQSIRRTAERRPDLILKVWDKLSKSERVLAEKSFKNAVK